MAQDRRIGGAANQSADGRGSLLAGRVAGDIDPAGRVLGQGYAGGVLRQPLGARPRILRVVCSWLRGIFAGERVEPLGEAGAEHAQRGMMHELAAIHEPGGCEEVQRDGVGGQGRGSLSDVFRGDGQRWAGHLRLAALIERLGSSPNGLTNSMALTSKRPRRPPFSWIGRPMPLSSISWVASAR